MTKPSGIVRRSLLAAGLMAVLAIGGNLKADAQSEASSITISSYRDVPHLDRHKVGGGELDALTIVDPLIVVDGEGNVHPGLAEKWEAIDEGRLRLTLRQDVTFSDGEKLNAQAVKLNLDRRIELTTSSNLKNLTGAEVVDEYTIDLLHKPQPLQGLLAELGIFAFIYSPRQINDDPASIETAPIGTGPYKVVSYDPAREVKLVARDDYWGANVEGWGTPSINNLTIRFGVEPGVAFAGLRAGEVHLVQQLTPENAQLVSEDMRIVRPSPELFFLRFGFKDKYTSNPKVREAINLAIDREALNAPFLGMGEPATQLWHSQISGWADRGPVPQPDVERAKELIKEAGAEGAELNFAYSTAYKPGIGLVSQAVAGMIEEIGLKVKMIDMDGTRYREYMRELDSPEPLSTISVGYDYPEPTDQVRARIGCGATMSTYCNKEVDKLLDEAGAAADAEKRKEILQKMMDVVAADNGVIPLISPPLIWGKSANLEVTPSYGFTMDVKAWKLKQ
jgi:peptide/nickel transport system substrate-binding protein